jgi:preprotein translocase subunit Sec63
MKISMEAKHIRRRRITLLVGFLVVGFLMWQVSTNLWYTQGGYCWGDMIECYAGK